MERNNPPSPPCVRVCVGQDCTKDGLPDAWTMVRTVAPRNVAVVPTNCLGPCGSGPCAMSIGLESDPNRKCPLVLLDNDGFYAMEGKPPPPAVLPSGIVKPRVAPNRKKLDSGCFVYRNQERGGRENFVPCYGIF